MHIYIYTHTDTYHQYANWNPRQAQDPHCQDQSLHARDKDGIVSAVAGLSGLCSTPLMYYTSQYKGISAHRN